MLRLITLGPVAVAVTGGCAQANSDEPDPLEALADAARTDAALAEVVAQHHPDLAGAAGAVAAARTQHAQALRREIDRANPPDPDAPPPRQPRTPETPSSAKQAKKDLSATLREAQRSAGRLVPGLPTHRAGLAGSVSASCASLVEILR